MQPLDPIEVWRDVEAIRQRSPLVHNITNYVAMNTTANALLAIGASPVMAHAIEEIEDMVAASSSLVVNIGTLSSPWIKAMLGAMSAARRKRIPVVLDPVGAGCTRFRTSTALELISVGKPTMIRGNASEMIALQTRTAATRGVDSLNSVDEAREAGSALAEKHQASVCISGPADLIISGKRTAVIRNGHPMMPRVTGLGCTASALIGAFAAVNPSSFKAMTHAMAVMSIAGEITAAKAAGPGTFQDIFIDALYNLEQKDITERLQADIYEP